MQADGIDPDTDLFNVLLYFSFPRFTKTVLADKINLRRVVSDLLYEKSSRERNFPSLQISKTYSLLP